MLLGIDNCYNRREREGEKRKRTSHLFRLITTLRMITSLFQDKIGFIR